MKKVQFIFGIHNHQPVGNFDEVFQHACDRSYLPFLQTLEKFPDVSIAFHFSGSLIEWLELNRPELLALLKKLVERGNVEILGAGFYEPVLAMIPENDRVGQIQKMTRWAKSAMNYDVRGNWLTERVWEPHLAASLKRAGIDYTIVDDFHFLSTGLDPNNLTGYYYTEQDGELIGVFPINQKLRYAMPFQDPQVTIDILKSYATEDGNHVIVMADDGEKFGIWPGSYDTVYTEKWLEHFLQALQDNSSWLKTTTFNEYFSSHKPAGLVYLPTSSYFEMSQWTLSTELGQNMEKLVHRLEDQGEAEQSKPFIKGGMWRNFFTKYPESNWMHKRIQAASLALSDVSLTLQNAASIQDDIYRAQCNCAYWHGVFGGLYLPHLRHALYEHLLKAENAMVEAGVKLPDSGDIDGDGHVEYRLRTSTVQVFFDGVTGTIREIDWLPATFNTTNFIQRYSESYHHKLAHANRDVGEGVSIHDLVLTKEEGLADKLFVDNYTRQNLIDHILGEAGSLHSFHTGDLDPARGATEVELEGNKVISTTMLEQLGIQKEIELIDNQLIFKISLMAKSDAVQNRRYGLEFNFGLLGGQSPDRYFLVNSKPGGPLNTLASDESVDSLTLVNEWDHFKIEFQFDDACLLWRAPIETISMSEAGFERVYQASSILPQWELKLSPGETQTIRFTLSINQFN